MILQTGKCPITTFSSDLNFQIFKFKCDQESLERKARVSEMEEEMKVNQRYLLFNNTVTVIYYINQGNIYYKSWIFTKS